MIEIDVRRDVGGTLYGPFILFTAYSSSRPEGRYLVMYTKVGTTWYRWDSPPQGSYTTQFFKMICARQAMSPELDKYVEYCGDVVDRTELERQANRLFTATINSFAAATKQSGQERGDPYKGRDPMADEAPDTVDKQGGWDLPPWAIPAAVAAAVLVWWQRRR
jgi:hypothetical protein